MPSLKELNDLRIPLDDIKLATNNFSDENLIGMDGDARVYRGELSHLEGIVTVTMKRFDRSIGQGDSEFWKEIIMLSPYKHVNIVSLIGFCAEYGEKILVYEFVIYGSLDYYLSNTNLTWLMRLQICLGAACGLNYLHNPLETQQRVLHRDIKSSHILLDQNWRAKITGFGLSKIAPMNPQFKFWITNVFGTIGYVDPIIVQTGSLTKTGGLTKKSDVYSFGVVLFEVLCGRPAYATDDDDKRFLAPIARLHYEEGKLNELIDPVLRKQMNTESLNAFSAIAYQCLELDKSKRPSMIRIVRKLKKALELQREFGKELAFQQVMIPTAEDDYYKANNSEHLKIPFEEINSATNGFHDHCIGCGGFGGVYKAELMHVDVRKYVRKNESDHEISMAPPFGYPKRKSKVAVKRLDRRHGQGKQEFLKEIEVLSRLKHHNVVSLLGFCNENDEMILVYEYASNGSLDMKIQAKYRLTWAQRLQICLDMAHGLNYIHNLGIIHRDIKSGNILLGGNWEGIIGDFGLSRISKHADSTSSVTNVVGTPAYTDPMYVKTGNLTKQSDIFSFGVVLLEVFCGRLAVPPKFAHDPEYLVHTAKRHFERKQLNQIFDPDLREELEKSSPIPDNKNLWDSVNTFAEITNECLYGNEDRHLTMADVIKELKKASTYHLTGVEILSLEAINAATKCFSQEHVIGKGTSGTVYRGDLSMSKRSPIVVAVKRLHRVGSDEEGAFFKRVAIFSRYIHENVIPLRGFCEEGSEKIIIFEHAINKSLDKHLDNSTLTWGLRLKICIGAAKGLHYIHTCVEPQHTVHGDIKSSNILLHHDWKATISDFIISEGLGTVGYMDPLFDADSPTKESDVYSFGVVLIEILSGKLGIQKVKYLKDIIGQFAARSYEDIKKPEAIIFDGIKEQTDAKSIDTFSEIAYKCLQEDQKKRPTMAQVLEGLKKAFEIHEEWELEQKLQDCEKIIKMSKYLASLKITKKDLFSHLSSGVLLDKGKVWISLSKDGKVNEMISTTNFSYKNHRYLKWISTKKSRFPKVAKMLEHSNPNKNSVFISRDHLWSLPRVQIL